MTSGFNDLIDQYDRGVIGRRQLLKGLLLLGVPFAAEEETAAQTRTSAIAPVLSINHAHSDVSDLKKSVEFYSAVLGAVPREAGPGIVTMGLPNQTKQVGSWISLTDMKRQQAMPATGGIGAAAGGVKAGTYSHVGYGANLSGDNPKRIVAELQKRWPGIKTGNPNRTDQLYIYDPDGLPIQLMIIDHDGYIASEKVSDGKGGMKDVAKYKPGEHLTP